jgi:hypothetical protein
MVIFIGPSKKLNDYSAQGAQYMKMVILRCKGPTQHVASTRPSSAWTRRNLCDGATCTTQYRASASLEARLGNPSLTCFHVKQATRSRRVSHTIALPSVLWHNRQTVAYLVLRHKPRNMILRPKSPNRSCRF